MKYTRYDYNKKKKGNLGISLIIVIVLGTVIGTSVFKLSQKGVKNIINNKGDVQASRTVNVSNKDISNYVGIQCGVYQNIDNANATLATIPTSFNSFVIEDNGKYKVIAGVYDESTAEAKVNELNALAINNFSIKFNINEQENDGIIVSEIMKGYLKIINKVSDENVESLNTKEFKEWVEKVTDKSDNKTIKELMKMTSELPDEFKKENNVEVMKNLYNLLSKYKA